MENLTLKKPNSFKLSLGVLLFIAGILLMISIIGFLPGIFILLVSVVFLMKTTECPKCKSKMGILTNSKNAKCKTCNSVFILAWD
jgi:flagellar biosynthesis component FlhA